ncbi:M48 family metalloprotease [Acidiphilium sp. C61]|uniref:M48 family metalloprotease n=1 Tax=Acidiphilium sp. C61 TaxID=1671485 RepID=UPI00157A589E|nr:M48 family metalloprotease [Acidiphilium sp. C61]
MANLVRTGLLMALLTALFMAVGYGVGGGTGASIAFAIAAAGNLVTYWVADRAVLAAYGARPADPAAFPRLVALVDLLARKAGLKVPRVFVIEADQPNAFATGRDPAHAAVAVTTGLLGALDEAELAGVLAHELSHIRHRDTLTMTVTATLAGAIGMMSNLALIFGGGDERRSSPFAGIGGALLLILAPLSATLVQLAISRAREYAADAGAAALTGQPLALARALSRIGEAARWVGNDDAERNPATASLFIVNPLAGTTFDALFATHPPLRERIARLRRMAQFDARAFSDQMESSDRI